ncbi:cytidine deaminase [Sphingobium sp.]|jgi:cytidine deaminase|uniref:cytidine deaminase n=1 Tax=Sphingobium sp. TaxID=1912891 RepID=UPI00257CD7FE|nr:cytidine deaminase [Sphingobium sp.]MBR2269555.1 cytidine deaminase [Sphingobium sp.]
MSAEDKNIAALVAAARGALAHAHAPYSRFAVGAAVRLTDGSIVTGSNFENASYGLSLCAETVALATVNAQGRLADVTEIAVVGGGMSADGSVGGEAIVSPCGRCRQVINEAEQMAGRTLAIYCVAPEGDGLVEHRVADLLPHAFGPADLGITPAQKS